MPLRGKAREEPRRDLGLSNMRVTGDSAEEGEGWERMSGGGEVEAATTNSFIFDHKGE